MNSATSELLNHPETLQPRPGVLYIAKKDFIGQFQDPVSLAPNGDKTFASFPVSEIPEEMSSFFNGKAPNLSSRSIVAHNKIDIEQPTWNNVSP